MNVTMYTDGSCLGNQNKNTENPGGYGVVLMAQGQKKTLSGGIENTTNVRAEMQAVIEGLSALKYPCVVELFTDAELIVNTMNKGWKRKKNLDLWYKIDELVVTHDVTFKWVKGHNKDRYNEEADTLAQVAATKLSIELAKRGAKVG